VVTKDAVEQMIEKTEHLVVDENPFTKDDQPQDRRSILPAYQAHASNSDNQVWLGQVTRDELTREHRIARDELADAAYMGRWDFVFDVLDEGVQRYREQWINGARLSRLTAFSFSPLTHVQNRRTSSVSCRYGRRCTKLHFLGLPLK
jgi:hypothetical protein